ncbi:MAG: LysR family transcriptional regulator [Colwellia sp.]|nr:LysR family transcriptional regulator [Colwellia sp.]MCW9080854.1 LysR family transcriptional regulator [Colwellia sp.]
MKIDLNLFTVFDAIYRERNITAAAKSLNLSQPAVSHALARLRDNFADPLFIRQGNKMQPTPIAKNVITDVQEALNQLQVTLAQSKQFDAKDSKKHCAISLHSSLEALYLPSLIKRFAEQAPNMRLTCTSVRRIELEHKLASGDIDLAMDVLLPVNDNIKHTSLANDELVVVAAKNHTLFEQSLDLNRYLAHNHVLVSSRFSGPGLEDFELGRLGLQRKVALRCQHFFSAGRVVANSDMLLTLPKSTATLLSQALSVNIYPLPVELPSIAIHIYWHENVDKDPANRWLRNKVLMASN